MNVAARSPAVARTATPARACHWTVERVHELFPLLRERAALRAKKLSGREQQMLAIGRSLRNNPRVMLLDEPSEGLAPIVIRTLIESIRQIRQSPSRCPNTDFAKRKRHLPSPFTACARSHQLGLGVALRFHSWTRYGRGRT